MADREAVDLRQSLAWRVSRQAARRYRETGNPLFAWESAGHALAAGVPMPSQVLAYIVRAAQALGAPPASIRLKDPRKHVARCLEFGGCGPSPFERRRRYERDLAVLDIEARLRRNLQLARGDALARAAEDAGLQPESIARQARRRTKLA